MRKRQEVTAQTKKNLINGFWKLYKNDNITRITIEKICKEANYDRTTFYRYFIDMEDIKNQLENSIIESIKKDIQNNARKESNGIFFDGFKKFTNKYGEYITIFHEKGSRNFYLQFKELIKSDVYNYLSFNIQDEVKKELLFELLFSSLINSYSYWYRHKKYMSLEVFVEFVNSILMNGANSIINFK